VRKTSIAATDRKATGAAQTETLQNEPSPVLCRPYESSISGLEWLLQHLMMEVLDAGSRSAEAGSDVSGQITSPGWPSVARREDRVRLWAAIAARPKTRNAGVAAGVSEPVAYRWFLRAGGVNPQLAPTLHSLNLLWTVPLAFAVGSFPTAILRFQRCGFHEYLGESAQSVFRYRRSHTMSGKSHVG